MKKSSAWFSIGFGLCLLLTAFMEIPDNNVGVLIFFAFAGLALVIRGIKGLKTKEVKQI